MYAPNAEARRPQRPTRHEKPSLGKQLLRRCLPRPLLHRVLRAGNTPAQRLGIRALVLLMTLLLLLLLVLLYHLFIEENDTLAQYLHFTSKPAAAAQWSTMTLPLESATPTEVAALKKRLRKFTPRSSGPQPRQSRNGFLPSYFDPEERLTPPLTAAALTAWSAADPTSAEVSEEVLLQHLEAGANVNETEASQRQLFDLLAFLFPPVQQQEYYRAALNRILGFGTRVGGTMREPLLHHLLDEGLGRSYYDAAQHAYRAAPHLSREGRSLLEKTSATAWPRAPAFMTTSDDADRIPGWRWSLMWDNFTATIPLRVRGQPPSSTVTLRNLVFQFPGGAQFRRKEAALAEPASVFVGHVPNPQRSRELYRVGLAPDEYHPLDEVPNAVYTQETFTTPGKHALPGWYIPDLQRGEPGTKAVISTPGEPVPLKPSLAASVAQPVSRQPIRHAVYAAHWDSMFSPTFPFLGACDSAVPMVHLLRTIKNIATLTDIAEVVTESFRAERVGAGVAAVPDGVVVPGLTATFRTSTTEAELRTRLATLLSPAHHALMYKYFFARPYTVGGDPVPQPPGAQNHARELTVDVRMWLDWVQHLPALSVVFFDAEEAFRVWQGNDHTYGARHLARQWRALKTTTETRYSGGPQSLFGSVDLFALYDLMGPAGTSFVNLHPTQSGIYYAALAQREVEKRQRALRHTSAITAELVWRVMGKGGAAATAPHGTPSDPYVRQLGPSTDLAMAALPTRHISKVLANASSRPTAEALPRAWLLYGTPHEMLTLHRIPLLEFVSQVRRDEGTVVHARLYDLIEASVIQRDDFDHETYLRNNSPNVFFNAFSADLLRRFGADPVIQDDHLHWLDTQRVLHLISYPFPQSWHQESDDGRDVHDGTTVDLGGVLWSAVLELGHYWTEEQ